MDDLDFGVTLRGATEGQRLFGRFLLARLLGQGGMGVVWLALDEQLRRDVALKLLPQLVASDPDAMADLRRETNRCLDLTHPNIIRIHDFLLERQQCAISMEFVDGKTLAALKVDQPGGCFDTGEITPWITELCEALEYAHTEGKVVHRDLKPSNLMVTKQGKLKVADFGIARSISDSMSRVSIQRGTSGTPPYMSPQQLMGEEVSVSDDIYAVGATLYDLLTGKPPFYTGDVMLQIREKTPVSMTERRQRMHVEGKAAIPQEWEETVAVCLSKHSEKRPASIADLRQMLGLGGPPQTTRRETAPNRPPVSPSSPAEQPSKRNTTLLVVGRCLLLLILGGVAYYFSVVQPKQQERIRQEQAARDAEATRLSAEAAAVPASPAESPAPIPAGKLVVNTVPSGAPIFLDGSFQGVSPMIINDLSAGSRRLQLSMDGYDTVDLIVNISAGTTTDPGAIHLTQKATPTPAPAPPVAESTPMPAATPDTSQDQPEETVRNLIRNELAGDDHDDQEAVLGCYAYPVDYFDEGVLTLAQLRESYRRFRQLWPSYSVSDLGDITVRNTDNADYQEAEYSYRFTARNPDNGKESTGIAHTAVVVRWINGSPYIVKIRETITDRSKNF